MFVQINNDPRSYDWGSNSALPNLLGTEPTGEPQAELWLGDHPGSPARVTKATPVSQTLIELIDSDPERYGVNGRGLPFLLKVLAIDSPLSLQTHPNLVQAAVGFAAEETAEVPQDARNRNYRDYNHKPELLVALTEVTALCGFRAISAARADIEALIECLPQGAGKYALEQANSFLQLDEDAVSVRERFTRWALSDAPEASTAAQAISKLLENHVQVAIDPLRLDALKRVCAHYPSDPGILVSLLLHVVRLEPGEAIYLDAGNLHAYLSGTAVEVMATSDNVLRGGFTSKHIDVQELCKVTAFTEIDSPLIRPRRCAPGLQLWEPGISDFSLYRADVCRELNAKSLGESEAGEAAAQVEIDLGAPSVLIVTRGQVRIEREEGGMRDIALLRQGQALYASAGDPLLITGEGQVYLATVGREAGESTAGQTCAKLSLGPRPPVGFARTT